MAVSPSEEYTQDEDEERWIRYSSLPLMATLLLPIIIGVIILLKCVFNHCCVRKTTTKDEMYGLEGRMTMLSTADSSFITIHENPHHSSIPPATEIGAKTNVNDGLKPLKAFASDAVPIRSSDKVHVGASYSLSNIDSEISAGPSGYDERKVELRRASDTSKLTQSMGSAELSGSLKRASAIHRQLPDLPPTPLTLGTGSRPARRSSSVLSHDGTSELYATVGESQFPEGSSKNHYAQIRDNQGNNNTLAVDSNQASSSAGVPTRSRGIEATPSSDSETYASSSSHHPYAKLKKNLGSQEHPYARVRAIGASNNDEETDTDNYDLPQFLRGEGGENSAAVPSTSREGAGRGAVQGEQVDGAGASGDASGPVPPRRVGRQWRRGSQPNVQNDNVSNFSGDSQDSRGYTSISVREPLSNIRNQLVANTRSYDSHYATVSDDSEEMYAAIDDPNDANYMRIPDQDGQPRRPTWLGGPSVSSPIPERREANSPLPPVPPVPPPGVPIPELGAAQQQQSSTTPPVPVPTSPNSSLKSAGLPVYAQVTKKSKKQPQPKVPVTPTLSNVSTSSSQIGREAPPQEGPKDTHHHRSKRAASLMDNSNPMDAEQSDRRWSKADISYSEFDVVRESMFPTGPGPSTANPRSPGPPGISPPAPRQAELLDEDNYNIIPEKSLRNLAPPTSSRNRLDSGNYQIIDPPRNIEQREPSDHYQEINDRRNDLESGQLYQEIERPEANIDEDEDDDDDDFYERVKKPPPTSSKGKKHGYEKIKKKNAPGNLSSVVPAYVSDDEDEDDKNDELYERVRYPPYERLKESKDDLYDSDEKKSDYEDIGYSRVKSKPNKGQKEQAKPPDKARRQEEQANSSNVEDVNQLYAQVDKSKKRKGSATLPQPRTNSNETTDNKRNDIYVNNNEPTQKSQEHEHLYSKVTKKGKNKNAPATTGPGPEQLVSDGNIEYL